MATASPEIRTARIVCGFPECAVQARALADALNVPYTPVDVHIFPDGESRVQALCNAEHVILYRPLHAPNAKIIEILLTASALRDQGVARITLVAPYLPYMRQDIAFHPGEAVSQRVIGEMLGTTFDKIITVDPHLHRTHDLSAVMAGKPSTVLSGAPAIATYIARSDTPKNALVVGPDEEAVTLTRAVADPLKLNWIVAAKVRHGDRNVEITLPQDRTATAETAIIVDDVISSGTTIVAISNLLRAHGVKTILVYATHALCTDDALTAMRDAGVNKVTSCDGVPHPTNDIPLGALIADAIR